MRSLQHIMEMMEEEGKWDYELFLCETKSIIENCDRNYKRFSQMRFRSGNETVMNDMTRDFQELLLKYKLVDAEKYKPVAAGENRLRKFTFFLLVNSDLNFKYNLKEDDYIAHIAGICPLMPPYLTCGLMWTLNLHKYFYEALSYTPTWFAFRFFEHAADSLSYIRDPFDVLEKANNLIQSILRSCARTEMRVIGEVDKVGTFNRLYDYAMTILRQFYTPDAKQMATFTTSRRNKYQGYVIKNSLEMAHFALDIYEKPELAMPQECHAIYEICLEQCKKVEFVPSAALKEQILKLVFAIFNSLHHNILLVTVGIYMTWCEYDLSDDETLQCAIGKMTYSLMERIQSNPTYEHDVAAKLLTIAHKPKTFKEIVESSNIGQILRRVEDDELQLETRKVWYDELFNRSITLTSDECISVATKHVFMIRFKHIAKILEFLALNLEMEERVDDYNFETKDEVKGLLSEGVKCLDWAELIMAFENQTKTFGKMTDVCEMDDFEDRAGLYFNTLSTAPLEDDFKSLLFENPSKIWLKFFNVAHYNKEMVDLFCNTLKSYRPHAKIYLHAILTNAMRDENRMQEKYFPALIAELYFTQFNPNKKSKFLDEYITSCINYHKTLNNFGCLNAIVKILYIISQQKDAQNLKQRNVTEFTAPVLLLIGQIMDYARWDFVTYDIERDILVQECIKFLQKNVGKFLPNALQKDRLWVSKFSKGLTKLQTKFYFQKFHTTEPDDILPFDEFIIPKEVVDKVELEKLLFAQLARCTSREIVWLARSPRLKPLMTKVLINFGIVASSEHAENQLNIYRNALLGYDSAVRAIYLEDVKNDKAQGYLLLLDVLKVINASPAIIFQEVFMNFQNLLISILQSCQTPWDFRHQTMIKEYLENMPPCSAKETLAENLDTFDYQEDCEGCEGSCEDQDSGEMHDADENVNVDDFIMIIDDAASSSATSK